MRSSEIYVWARGLAVIDVCFAIYIAITEMSAWRRSRRTHRRYGEDNWRTSWPALFRTLRGGRRGGSIS